MVPLTLLALHMMFSSALVDFCQTYYEVINSCDVAYGNVLKTIGDVRSLTECSTECSEDDRCISVMYDLIDKVCQLNSERPLALSTDCSSQIRVATLTRSSCHRLIHQACSGSTQCAVANSQCESGTCQCNHGYNYNYVDETCTTSGTDSGTTSGTDSGTTSGSIACTTYTMLEDHALIVTSLTTYSGVTLEQCKAHCTSMPDCRSFNFTADNLCTLKAVADSPSPYPGIDHYVKDCDLAFFP